MITLYDIPSKLPEKAWSPNTFKARISLNYKEMPYKTEWVEYPDIEATVKRLGGAPTWKKDDSRYLYTLPAIHDSATGKVITDSEKIAEYLDATYPDKPSLFPPGARTAIATLEHIYMETIFKLLPILFPASHSILNPPSEAYFRFAREQKFGKKLEDFAPPGPSRDAIWKEVKEGFNRIAEFYDRNGEDKHFYLEDTFSFADAIVVAFLTWTKNVLGRESDEWKTLSSWNNGRWGKVVEVTKALQTVN